MAKTWRRPKRVFDLHNPPRGPGDPWFGNGEAEEEPGATRPSPGRGVWGSRNHHRRRRRRGKWDVYFFVYFLALSCAGTGVVVRTRARLTRSTTSISKRFSISSRSSKWATQDGGLKKLIDEHRRRRWSSTKEYGRLC